MIKIKEKFKKFIINFEKNLENTIKELDVHYDKVCNIVEEILTLNILTDKERKLYHQEIDVLEKLKYEKLTILQEKKLMKKLKKIRKNQKKAEKEREKSDLK